MCFCGQHRHLPRPLVAPKTRRTWQLARARSQRHFKKPQEAKGTCGGTRLLQQKHVALGNLPRQEAHTTSRSLKKPKALAGAPAGVFWWPNSFQQNDASSDRKDGPPRRTPCMLHDAATCCNALNGRRTFSCVRSHAIAAPHAHPKRNHELCQAPPASPPANFATLPRCAHRRKFVEQSATKSALR